MVSKQLPLTIEQTVKTNKNFIIINYMNMWISKVGLASKGGIAATHTVKTTLRLLLDLNLSHLDHPRMIRHYHQDLS